MALGMPWRSVQHVYFDDLDALNILHNMRYLLFMERARGELFNALGEGEVAIEIAPTHLGTSSITLHAVVKSLDGKQLYAEGSTRLVRLDPSTNRPCPWSQPFRDKMEKLVRQATS